MAVKLKWNKKKHVRWIFLVFKLKKVGCEWEIIVCELKKRECLSMDGFVLMAEWVCLVKRDRMVFKAKKKDLNLFKKNSIHISIKS
jgi:hypothetical protein